MATGNRLNSTLRKITPARVVTTLGDPAGLFGSEDGAGSAAHFLRPDAGVRELETRLSYDAQG